VAGKLEQIPSRLSKWRRAGTPAKDNVIFAVLHAFQNPFGPVHLYLSSKLRQLGWQLPEL